MRNGQWGDVARCVVYCMDLGMVDGSFFAAFVDFWKLLPVAIDGELCAIIAAFSSWLSRDVLF